MLAFAGGVGTGFTQRRLEELTARLRALRTDECPFDPPPPTAYRRGATWVEPVLRAIVEITEFTNEGYVRQSSFIDLVDVPTIGRSPTYPTRARDRRARRSTPPTRWRRGGSGS